MSPFQARAERKELDFPVELSSDDARSRSIATSLNISTTGMLVLSKEPSPTGSIVSFESVPASGKAEVIWTRPRGEEGVLMGLAFRWLRRVEETIVAAGTAEPELDPDRIAWKQAWSEDTGDDISFRAATDRLMEQGFTLAEIGFALGSPVETIRRARLGTSATQYSRPPRGWKEKIAELARGHGLALDALADELTGS